MEIRRDTWLLQGTAGSDLENRSEFSVAFDDQGENHQNYMGSYTRNQKVSLANKRTTEECLKCLIRPCRNMLEPHVNSCELISKLDKTSPYRVQANSFQRGNFSSL